MLRSPAAPPRDQKRSLELCRVLEGVRPPPPPSLAPSLAHWQVFCDLLGEGEGSVTLTPSQRGKLLGAAAALHDEAVRAHSALAHSTRLVDAAVLRIARKAVRV